MTKTLPKYPRILGIALSTRGLGFALLEGQNILADWGLKAIDGDKNNGSIARVREMIEHYEPDVLVLEDTSIKPFRRSTRIRMLTKRIIFRAEKRNVTVLLFPREQVSRTFVPDGHGTKHQIAQIIADKFSDELGFRLPPKRVPWKSEDARMDMFGAVALALMPRSFISAVLLSIPPVDREQVLRDRG